MRILTNVNIDWLRWRWHALAVSWLIILAGVFVVATRGVPLGIDFSGGTLVVVRFEQPVGDQTVRDALAGIPGEKVIQQYGDPNNREILIRMPLVGESEEGGTGQIGGRIISGLQQANLGKFEVRSTEFVGPVIGAELQRKGIYATIASMLGILAYISFRFRLSFGIGAFVASMHDILITMSLFTFAGYELSLNVVAALLTLVGYGVNDQIVIFDRVRENLRASRTEPMNVVINKSVNQTLPRTVITAGATALAVLSLYLFGGEVLSGFAFTMIVGIITGTYSSVFVAAAIVTFWNRKSTRMSGAAEAAPTAATQPPSRRSKAQRKAKAS